MSQAPDLRSLWTQALQHEQEGHDRAAAESCETILRFAPNEPAVLGKLGNLLCRLGDTERGLDALRRAVTLRPRDFDRCIALARALFDARQYRKAMSACEKALVVDPRSVTALSLRSDAEFHLGRLAEAAAGYAFVLTITPDRDDLHRRHAHALHRLGRIAEAVPAYDRALAIRPDAETWRNRAEALWRLSRIEEAVASIEAALPLSAQPVELLCELAQWHLTAARYAEAASLYRRALTVDPRCARARLGLCVAQLPPVSRSESEVDAARHAYAEELRRLGDDFDREYSAAELADAAGALHPFHLAYQGRNDRDLQATYGSIMCRAMAARYRQPALPRPPRSGEKVRVGIVSAFLHAHSNWKVPIRGWLAQLDRSRFQVSGYYTDEKEDGITLAAASLCDRFVRGPLSVADWATTISGDAPHVLIYPEIGMNSVVIQLAMQRLARVQCTSWGHPETSGFPTIDHFLSSALMEPPDGDAFYTERLIRLPGLSFHYEPVDMLPEPPARAEIGLRQDSVAYWCGQYLGKFQPRFDHVFPSIAQAVGDCQFVFTGVPPGAVASQIFRERMAAAFGAIGLDVQRHCVFLPALSFRRFLGTMSLCQVGLDSVGWSGCNTTLESLPFRLPLVTLEDGPMRARHTAAILRVMGLTETIATTVQDYIANAVRLAKDSEWRATLSVQMGERAERVYRDRVCIVALEDFLDQAARSGTPR